MTLTSLARLACCAMTLGLLSACATAPKVSSQVESSRYRAHASRNYTAPGPASDPWGPYIKEASAKFDVPEKWIREVMRQESGGRLYGRNGGLITSGAGAMGLMQVMPGTYDELRARYTELGDDPYDPHNNILAGTAYVREMYDIYGAPGFLAAYNAGPGRLDDYLTRNRTLPEETRRYVANIGPRISGYEPSRPSPGAQYAMNNLPSSIPSGTRYAAADRYSAPAATPVSAPITLGPIRLAPVAVAQVRTPPAPVQVAELPAPAPVQAAGDPFITLNPPAPEPTQFVQMPEPPRYAAPEPRYAQLEPAPVPTPPEPPRSFAQATQPSAPQSYAPLPLPPPLPRSQSQLAAAALVPVAPRGSLPFGLVSQANAAPLGRPAPSASSAGSWAVQVGAFANEGLASSAATAARGQARDLLGAARPSVTPVRQAHGTLYRARLGGLSRDAAAQACERLARSRTTCMMVSPDAQS